MRSSCSSRLPPPCRPTATDCRSTTQVQHEIALGDFDCRAGLRGWRPRRRTHDRQVRGGRWRLGFDLRGAEASLDHQSPHRPPAQRAGRQARQPSRHCGCEQGQRAREIRQNLPRALSEPSATATPTRRWPLTPVAATGHRPVASPRRYPPPRRSRAPASPPRHHSAARRGV